MRHTPFDKRGLLFLQLSRISGQNHRPFLANDHCVLYAHASGIGVESAITHAITTFASSGGGSFSPWKKAWPGGK